MISKIKHALMRWYTIKLSLISYVFAVFFITTIMVGIVTIELIRFGIIVPQNGYRFIVVVLLSSCIIIGTALSAFASKWLLEPFQKIIMATKEIASGNFNVHLEETGPLEIKHISNSFNQMALDLRKVETLRTDFVSNVSHEFKTPVSSIKGFAKLLKKDTLDSESRNEYLDIIIKESERLGNLSNKVLLLTKLENQVMELTKNFFSLDEQIRHVVLLFEQEWKRKNIEVEVELSPVTFFGNEELMEEVWTNLISNAIKFTGQNGTLLIKLYREHDIVVKISDTGIGITDESIKHIFDKFYQGDHSRATQGNGLGLSLVKKIVELSNGRIKVESKIGCGSTFYIYFTIDRNINMDL